MRSHLLTACSLTALALSGNAESLLQNGSFEEPAVTGRTAAVRGGSPALGVESTAWASLTADAAPEGGTLQAGLTDEIARTGKQSLYVNFDHVTTSGRKAVLKTKAIPVEPGQAYRLSLWGRIDAKRPLALDESRPQMWLEVRFYKEDQQTEVGEAIAGSQFIPGEVTPGWRHPLHFVSMKWKETSAEVSTPADARFLKITWYWLTTDEEGATDGTIYFDDATLNKVVAAPAASPGQGAEQAVPQSKDAPVPAVGN